MLEDKRKEIVDKINYEHMNCLNNNNRICVDMSMPKLITGTLNREINNLKYREECSHDLWIYIGSFKINPDRQYEEWFDGFIPCNEDSEKLEFNKYMCIECGKIVCVKNYKEFEENNTIFKQLKVLPYELYDNADSLQRMYYMKLYNMNSNRALDEIKSENPTLLLKK